MKVRIIFIILFVTSLIFFDFFTVLVIGCVFHFVAYLFFSAMFVSRGWRMKECDDTDRRQSKYFDKEQSDPYFVYNKGQKTVLEDSSELCSLERGE
jgi:hypothetical protein